MVDREYAFGWLVLGMGYTVPKAANIAANASTPNIERWAGQQKQALTAFAKLLSSDSVRSEDGTKNG